MSFESRKASRAGIKPLIGVYAESGCGKTMSALLLARGMVGPNGNIQQIDTESGRGELYADVIPGGYNSIRFNEPFSPDRYIEAVRFAESQSADIIVIDQISSEWEGISGVLDMASRNEEDGKKGLSVWKQPKMEHAKMMGRLLQSPCPIIVCLRAKYKSRQVKQGGRTEIVKDDHVTPIQADDFIFEMTAHLEIQSDHTIRLTKCSHPELRKCFPADGTEPIDVKHGELIAKWANAGALSGPQKPAAEPSPEKERIALKKRIWDRAKPYYKTLEELEAWLRGGKLLLVDECLTDATNEQLAAICTAVEEALEAKW